jgi:hypothetical protein
VKGALVALLTAWLLCACPDKGAPQEPRSSLRVPLPDGWHATAVTGGLHVGPANHVVLQLESTSRELPTLEALLADLEREKVEIKQKESIDTFVGARYRVGEGVEGFLGVRKAGPRTIWCATTREATLDEVEASMTVCRSLSWDP